MTVRATGPSKRNSRVWPGTTTPHRERRRWWRRRQRWLGVAITGKNGSSKKKPKPRAADVDSKSTLHTDPVGLAVEMGTDARDAVSPSRRRSETCAPSAPSARSVDSRSGIVLTSFKAWSSGKDRTTSSPTTRGHRTHGYRARGRAGAGKARPSRS